MKHKTNTVSRRTFLAGSATLAAGAAFGPFIRTAKAARSVKVGAYGGYFKDSFDKHIFPDFTDATGITVESVAEPTGETWVVQLRNAAKAGMAPADVSMISGTPRLRAEAEGLWMPLDEDKMPNVTKHMSDAFIHRYPDGRLYGVGAVSWFITLCSNTEAYAEAPTSWADMWDPKYKDSLGLLA